MSSGPFSLGLPVTDRLPAMSGEWVLRSDSREQMLRKIRRMQEMLTPRDLIMVHDIGYRPDKPVPLRKFFAEVRIYMGDPDRHFNVWWWAGYRGKRKSVIVY